MIFNQQVYSICSPKLETELLSDSLSYKVGKKNEWMNERGNPSRLKLNKQTPCLLLAVATLWMMQWFGLVGFKGLKMA